jgi:hypothetical protein
LFLVASKVKERAAAGMLWRARALLEATKSVPRVMTFLSPDMVER